MSVQSKKSKREREKLAQQKPHGLSLSVSQLSSATSDQLLQRYGMISSLPKTSEDPTEITVENYVSPYDSLESTAFLDNLSYVEDKRTWKAYEKFSQADLSHHLDHLVKLIQESLVEHKPDDVLRFIATEFFSPENIETFRTDFL